MRRSAPPVLRVARRVVPALLVLFALSFAAPAASQLPLELGPGDQLYEVYLVDGSSTFARVEAADSLRVVFQTVGGIRMEVPRTRIRSVVPAQGRMVGAEFWRRDPNTSRLMFSATGRTLAAGEAYLGTYFIVLPFAAVGVTDALTVAAGAPLTVGEIQPFYIAPKLRIISSAGTDVAIGTLLFVTDDEQVGIAYGVGTFGNPDRAFTLGLGFGYSGADFSSQPVAMLGGEVRTSRRIKMMTENYVLPGETGVVVSLGLRFIGDRFSTDVGMAAAAGEDGGGCCLPLLNFSYHFDGRR